MEKFFRQSEQILRKNLETAARTLKLQMEVQNSGLRPATDVRVKMHFPNGFKLLEEEDSDNCFQAMPAAPVHPSKWGRPFDIENYRYFPELTVPNPKTINIQGPWLSIEETQSYDVRWGVAKLRQGDRRAIEPLNLVFDERPFSFAIGYEIVADNVPDIVHGELSVVA